MEQGSFSTEEKPVGFRSTEAAVDAAPMDTLSTLIYRSLATPKPADIDLYYLLAQARERNRALGLSGLLLYDRGFYFQWLEGESASLGLVWSSIRRDGRHAEIVVLADQAIPVRLFDDWAMGFAHHDRAHGRIIDDFQEADTATLDDLHLNPMRTPSILGALSKRGGAFSAL